jgi:CBS domain containing-hemolysin-like protein
LTRHDEEATESSSPAKSLLHAIRRPLVLLAISLTCLALHYVLLRAMAHGHVAHVLLGAGNAPPKTTDAILAIALVVVRFLSVIIVPGLLLAVAAELLAYLLVGPKHEGDEDDEVHELDA